MMADNVLFVFPASAMEDGDIDPATFANADTGLIAYRAVRLFDDGSINPHEVTQLPGVRMPEAYAGGVLKLIGQYCMVDANTSDKAYLSAKCEALTDGDAGVDSESWDTGNLLAKTVPDTAHEIDDFEITLTNKDSVEVGDSFRIQFRRLGGNKTNDTAAGDLALFCLSLVEVV